LIIETLNTVISVYILQKDQGPVSYCDTNQILDLWISPVSIPNNIWRFIIKR